MIGDTLRSIEDDGYRERQNGPHQKYRGETEEHRMAVES